MLYNIYRFDTLYFLFAENAFFDPTDRKTENFKAIFCIRLMLRRVAKCLQLK